MSGKRCNSCGRELAVGETAYASDWNVFDSSGETLGWRHETRYTCEDCEDAA